MEAFFLFILVVVLLILTGVAISVRLYKRSAPRTGRFRRIRRLRSLRPLPNGTVIEEIIDEEAPVEQKSSA
jgi:hypothetical protein